MFLILTSSQSCTAHLIQALSPSISVYLANLSRLSGSESLQYICSLCCAEMLEIRVMEAVTAAEKATV